MSSYSEQSVAKMRVVVDVIEREIAQSPSSAAFHAAWTELVALLALLPAPETRECPKCHAIGMRAASRCSRCWVALEPLPATASATHGDAR